MRNAGRDSRSSRAAVMSMGVLVTLLSGDQTHISVTEDALVDVLRQKAQKKLNASIGPLITASGSLLQGSATLKQAGLQDGDTVTAVLRAFLVLKGGSGSLDS